MTLSFKYTDINRYEFSIYLYMTHYFSDDFEFSGDEFIKRQQIIDKYVLDIGIFTRCLFS